MCRSARFVCVTGALALMLTACGMEESQQSRGPLDIPRGLGKADSAFSCKGHCGDKAPGCYCDSKCDQYGDCCPDKAAVCDGNPVQTCADLKCAAGYHCEMKGINGGAIPVCIKDSQICGGIAGIQCPSGQKCKLDGTYPDAAGTCVPETYCDTPADCVGLIHPMCVGHWQCVSNACSYKCGLVPPPPATCGPFPGGQCDPGYVCDIKSCGLGASGTCVPLPKCDPGFSDPVCGCNGTTYNNDCMRRAAGVALDHTGACNPPKPGKCFTDADCGAKEFCALKPGECLLPTFNILQGTCAPKPEACTMQYDPVCGCDGKTHSNACMAAGKGVNVASKGACKPTPVSYCQGFCGGKSSHNCYCDAKCDSYGDCCPDVKQACPNL